MAPPISALLSDLDADEMLSDFLQVLTLVGFDASTWEPGDMPYDFTDGVTTWLCNIWNKKVSPKLRARFIRTASGDDLTEEAWANYSRPRQAATFGVGDVVIENRGVGVGTIAVGTLRVANAAGETFTNTSSAFMAIWSGSGPYPTVTLQMQADVAGSGGNTLADELPTYPTAPRTAPFAGLYVQSNAALLGADEEEDELLKRRMTLAAAENGLAPRARLEAIARDPIGSMTRAGYPIPSTWPPTVNVTRVRVLEPGAGVFRMIIASPSGAAAGSTITADSDVFIVNAAVQLLGVPPGGTASVEPAVEVPLAYGLLALWVRRESNVTKAEAEARAGADVTTFFRTLAIGGERKIAGAQGYVLQEHLLAVATQGPGVFQAATQLIAADVALADNEVAVPTFTTSAALITQGV